MKYIISLVLCIFIACSSDEPKPIHENYQDTWYYSYGPAGIAGKFAIFQDQLDAETFTLHGVNHQVVSAFVSLTDNNKPYYIFVESENTTHGLYFTIISGNPDKLKCKLVYKEYNVSTEVIAYLQRDEP